MSFTNANAAFSKIASLRPSTPEQKLAIELAAALLELVKELESKLDDLKRKVEKIPR